MNPGSILQKERITAHRKITNISKLTSCARGDTICLGPLQVDTIFVFIRQVAVLFRHNNIVFIR